MLSRQETCSSIFPRLFKGKKKDFFVIVFISVGMEMDKVVKADQQVTAPPPQKLGHGCLVLLLQRHRPVGGHLYIS
jgi:hypothetical protein